MNRGCPGIRKLPAGLYYKSDVICHRVGEAKSDEGNAPTNDHRNAVQAQTFVEHFANLYHPQRAGRNEMKIRLLAAFLICLTATGHPGVIDDLKAMAAQYGMQYYGTSDRPGKAYYVFMDSEHNLLVSIPADIQTNDQAALCFQSGWASASATHGLADSAKQPIQKFKTGTWLDFPVATPLVWWSPEQVTQSYGLPGKVVPAKDGSKSWVYEWKNENTLVQLTFGFDPAGHMSMWVMSQVVLDKRQEKPTPEPSVSPKKGP
jgi:hypothetical protein